jgi:hypothetical protein
MSADTTEEAAALDDALYALRALRNCLRFKTRESKVTERRQAGSLPKPEGAVDHVRPLGPGVPGAVNTLRRHQCLVD